MAAAPSSSASGVLREGWALCVAGFTSAFPWVLAAELLQELPFANPPGSILTTDLAQYGQADYLIKALVLGLLQALLYGIAVLKLAGTSGNFWWPALRATPSVLAAYICYEVAVGFGLLFTFAFFMLGMFIIGPLGGMVLCILPLAPTAAASTAMALFIFPAVLDRRDPFSALGESSRLAKRSWAKVSLVISVPALALLATSIIGDITAIHRDVVQGLELLQRAQESGVSMEQADSLLAGFKAQPESSRYEMWQLIGTLLGAFAWWYTLAVCYAQYRNLKEGEKA
jgi:hypothetical protein